MTPIRYLAIAGTGGAWRADEWHHPKSPFCSFLRTRGLAPIVEDDRRGYGWDTAVDGVFGRDDIWDYAGRNLFHYFVPPMGSGEPSIQPTETFIITHSDGGEVVAYACGKYGLKINGLITVATPIRKNLTPLYEAAAKNITRHLHLHAGWLDYIQVLGSLFDGGFGIHREHPFAINQQIPGGHDDVLRRPELFPLWESEGWLDIWRGDQR